MLYLDSAVFIYATISRESVGDRARELLCKVRDGEEEATSCALAFDEIVWVVMKHRERPDALAAGEAFLSFPNLKVPDVGETDLRSAASLMRRYPLAPRDAIHASAALNSKCSAIVSSDAHFDVISGIRRRPI